jgi:hypothetical protein
MLASTALSEPEVGWVLLGNCNDWVRERFDLALTGRVLSIYEATDAYGGTCEPVFAASPALARRHEVRLATGLGHGFLYRPLPQWVEPARAWIAREPAGAGATP